ncbi:MAG: oxidoreductase [Cyclobacteriaceae bacterium]|nr:oxidoreductase [Cyclobacteriaceae bacterium]
MATALIAGATGLVGSHLLTLLLEDPHYSKVISVSRKPSGREHPKLSQVIVDFNKLGDVAESLKADDVYCCLGTTIRQAGSKEVFRNVDYGYPLQLANLTKAQGAKQYLLITALGSDKSSSVFYNRVKGEVEEAIGKVGFANFHIFQPSMLLGERTENRAGEGVGKAVMKTLDFLIPKKYKAIDGAKVACAMLRVAKQNVAGTHIHSSGEMQDD